MSSVHDKFLDESPLLCIDIVLGGRGRFRRNAKRRVLWAMLQQEQPGASKRAELPQQLSHDEVVEILEELSRADATTDLAKRRLAELMERFPEDHHSSAVLGLSEQFIEQAAMDQARVELFSLLLERAALTPADRQLLEHARTSIETRMMEYILPVLDARQLTDWDLKERAHLAELGTNPARASQIDEKLETHATLRGRVLMRALSAGTSLTAAEEQERARWK